MQRIQLAVYPDVPGAWRNVDRWPDSRARKAAYDLIVRLNRVKAIELGTEADADAPDGIPYLRFDAAAQARFDQWRGLLENRLRCRTDHTAIVAHLAKYRSLVPSLALLIHLAEDRVGRVGSEALERAIGWGQYLESHARRIYSTAIAPDTVEAIALATKILARELKDGFALRDVYRRGWIGLNSKESAARAVEVLCDLDWLTETVERRPVAPEHAIESIQKFRKTL